MEVRHLLKGRVLLEKTRYFCMFYWFLFETFFQLFYHVICWFTCRFEGNSMHGSLNRNISLKRKFKTEETRRKWSFENSNFQNRVLTTTLCATIIQYKPDFLDEVNGFLTKPFIKMNHFLGLKDLTLKNQIFVGINFCKFRRFYRIRNKIMKFTKVPAKKASILASQEVTVPKKFFFFKLNIDI